MFDYESTSAYQDDMVEDPLRKHQHNVANHTNGDVKD